MTSVLFLPVLCSYVHASPGLPVAFDSLALVAGQSDLDVVVTTDLDAVFVVDTEKLHSHPNWDSSDMCSSKDRHTSQTIDYR